MAGLVRKTAVVLTALFLPLLVNAQLLNPVKWSFTQSKATNNSAELRFTATIDEGWHLYAMNLPEGGPVSTSITFQKIEGATLDGSVKTLTKPTTAFDKTFGMDLSWYANKAVFAQQVTITDPARFTITGSVRYMSCDNTQCLAPTNEAFTFTSSKPVSGTKQSTNASQATGVKTEELQTGAGKTVATKTIPIEAVLVEAAPVKNILSDKYSQPAGAIQSPSDSPLWKPVIEEQKALGETTTHSDTSWWILLLSGFLGGLLALLTPCVWPIIPMTVSFFLKRNKDRRKAISDAILYGLSIVVIYLALGLGVTALFGASALNSLSTSAVFNILFFLILVVFGISFLGAFELTLPASWTTRMDRKADTTSGLVSIFFMAFTLVLVSFSCTGPIIGTLLVQAASMNSLLGPATGMLGFALALAIPFALFALFPSWLQNLPKSGGWLNTVKVVLGFLELAFALKFLSVADLAYGWGILSRATFISIWIVLFLLLGLYLLGIIRLPHDDKQEHVSVPRLMLALASLAFSVYMVPGLWGANIKAISAFAPPTSTQDFNLNTHDVKATYTSYEAGMEAARLQQKPVLIDFSGFGCVNCRKMESSVWQAPSVRTLLQEDFILITLMVDDKTPLPGGSYTVTEDGTERSINTVGDHWSYLQRHKFGANAQPYYVILNQNGLPLSPSRGYNEDVDAFARFLKDGLSAYKKTQNLTDKAVRILWKKSDFHRFQLKYFSYFARQIMLRLGHT